MGRDRIALLTGISDWVIARIRDRQQATANRDTVARLLACPVDLAEGMTTTSWWTRKYILALRAEGYTDQTIAQWIGSWPPDIFSRVRVRQRTARRAATIYRAISADDLPAGPSLLGFLTNRSRPESHVD